MNKRWMIILFYILLLSGFIFQITGHRYELSGVSASHSYPNTMSGIMEGTWQAQTEDAIIDNCVLRSWLIPIRNQVTYSVFRTSPHISVTLGKKGYLYEEQYILEKLQITPPISDEALETLIAKLCLLQERLASRGKILFLFISPSKAYVYPEYIPDSYVSIAPEHFEMSSYEKLLSHLQQKSIPYYDSVPFVVSTRDSTEYPAYTATGIHWSHVKGFAVTQQLADAMEEQLDINLPEFELSWIPVPTAIGADNDTEELLNIFSRQAIAYYAPGVTITDAERDNLHLLARGGSFMGATVYNMMDFDFFDSTYYMENTQLIYQKKVSYFTSYEELPIAERLEDADILLLEVNQESIENMSFGFIDYLLENILLD